MSGIHTSITSPGKASPVFITDVFTVPPPERVWQPGIDFSDIPLPPWIEELWIRRGCPKLKGSERYAPEGQALIWFVSDWFRSRAPYRFPVPREIADWLNATEVDVTREVTNRPGLYGPVDCDAEKPVTRLMRCAAEHSGRRANFRNASEYYDFLAWYALFFLPEANLPGALLPQAVVDLLNAPAGGEAYPLTVGMWLYMKAAYPDELKKLRPDDRERLLAVSFRALEEILPVCDPRLIPSFVSAWWRRRPLKLVTAFEYVAFHSESRSVEKPVDASEEEIRDWFQREAAGRYRGLGVMSGRPASAVAASEHAEPLLDRAVVIYRDHENISGLSKAGMVMRDGMRAAGAPLFDLHFSLGRQRLDQEYERNREVWINARRKLHVFNMNPEYVPECYYSHLHRMGTADYVVGQFAWEFTTISKAHEPGIGMVDEIWTGSTFLTDVYSAAVSKPVLTMGQAITALPPSLPLSREQFGFPRDAYLFLVNFDATSIIERKNPAAAITAFQKAFSRGTERVGLILKTRNLEHIQTARDREHWAAALERARNDARIRVIDYTMPEDALAALYRMCNCFVSLHRSEGFGFGPAEAMAHGLPAIVTDYSGVRDFCTAATAKLVPYELIRVRNDEYPYLDPGRVYEWAEPDVTVAAGCMRELAEDREQSERLGRAARELMSREFSISAVRRRYVKRLRELGFLDSARPATV